MKRAIGLFVDISAFLALDIAITQSYGAWFGFLSIILLCAYGFYWFIDGVTS